jgi:hypothetical protein
MAGKREDAALVVELAKWGSMIGLPEASRTIFSDEFDPESAEALDLHVQTVLIFHETVGTLVKNELLDRDLVLDWLWPSRPAPPPACRSCGRTSRRWRRPSRRRSASPATIRRRGGS